MSENQVEKLIGSVEDVRLFNEQNGYTVFELGTQEELVIVVGETSGLQVGEEVEVTGNWTFHQRFGRQFKIETIKMTLPSDAAGQLRYLSSGAIKGVKEGLALKIVEKFGAETFNIIDKQYTELSSIRGISSAMAKKIHRDFVLKFHLREVITGLTDLGFTTNEAIKAYNRFRDDAYKILSQNPYALCVADGFSFDRALEIESKMKKKVVFSFKGQAGIVHILGHNLFSNGHTCIPRKKIIKTAQNLLECNEDMVEIAIDDSIESKKIVSEIINNDEYLFLPEIYNDEKAIADRINVMLRFPPKECEIFPSEVSSFEIANKISFDKKQKSAIEIAVNKGLLILTGGPGTGKTTTVKGIITLMKNKGLNVALTAPTGRAAQRMTELTGAEAKTIHRLLEVKFNGNSEKVEFEHNLKNPLNFDAVIVDELSMVDVTVFSALLDALPLGCRLIMVGDKDQLPPVGAGNVLADLIKSEFIDVVTLDTVFRQASKSLIVTNAHTIVNGKIPVLDRKDSESDFYFTRVENPFQAARKVTDFVTRRLPEFYGLDVNDIQVLCPSKMGEVGTANLNKMLQEIINPPDKKKAEMYIKGYTLREGDKVMQIKNNYDVPWFRADEHSTGVFNGDIGILTRIDKANNIINVKFADKEAMYSIENIRELELAYAMTVHKSQGSEFDAVVIPVLSVPQKLCYRNLFYTAVTRAKKLLVLVGLEETIKSMVKNDKKSLRYSALVHFLSVDNDEFID